MKLTNKKVEQLTTNTKSYIVWDTDVRGFGVRVNLNAKKTTTKSMNFMDHLENIRRHSIHTEIILNF